MRQPLMIVAPLTMFALVTAALLNFSVSETIGKASA